MFELDDTVIEDIIFAMENQDSEALVDTRTGRVIMYTDSDPEPSQELPEECSAEYPESFVPIPAWSSADGFHLMEAFVGGIGDPVARLELLGVLSRGRGVFRAFKNTLEQYPEIERRWFEYKHTAMGRRVTEWYEALRVASGLIRLGPEPEDDTDLLLGDFSLRKTDRGAWADCQSLLRKGFEETLERLPRVLTEYEYSRIEKELSEGGPEDLALYLAEAPGGALAGLAAVRRISQSGSTFGKLSFLYIDEAHRRLGLARRLAEMAREDFFVQGICRFIIDLPFAPAGFDSSLAAYGYETYGVRCLVVQN